MDYYRILEVHREASPEVIDKAYRVLCRRYHPDRQDGKNKVWATAEMQEINIAYAVLKDPIRRAEYDEQSRPSLALWWEEGLLGLARAWVAAAKWDAGRR